MTQIILNLPEKVAIQAKQAAVTLKRPVEEMLADMLAAILPSVQDAPESMQTELIEMTWVDNKTLWEIARRSMLDQDQVRLRELAIKETLSSDEKEERNQLQANYGRITLLKARAYAILSLRGGIPILQ